MFVFTEPLGGSHLTLIKKPDFEASTSCSKIKLHERWLLSHIEILSVLLGCFTEELMVTVAYTLYFFFKAL